MRSLTTAREVCERHQPGLLAALESLPFTEREATGSPAVALLREHGGAGLLVPVEYGGQGADVLDAVRVQRAVGAVSPSLAAASTMHHFTVAMMFGLASGAGRLTPDQTKLLHGIASERLLLASGWAEGRTQQNILIPSVTATETEGGYLLNGAKKPCSLARSMDVLTASIAVPGLDGTPELALALVPADSPGLSVHPFWGNEVLAASESDEVRLTDVFVPREMVVRTLPEEPHLLDDLQTTGFIWFELLISAGYAGAATALAATVLERGRGSAGERAALAVRVESAFALLEGVARAVRDGLGGEAAVADILVARYAAQETLVQAADQALDLLGGIDFIRNGEHTRLADSVRPLAFHPPGRASAAEPLLQWFGGGALELS
ncbi:acyl-CoA dehydrogenase family protein [Streptomyces graminilatus]|uniref:acyl-CoA dehydrogenase family protein n=1 Tax=Streptomyces graminilatus TaxID=1464070 RepID=UPI0006E3DE8F|nr:acyl-CoA dehydrogenase family protein [Streptomyces graminilatus]